MSQQGRNTLHGILALLFIWPLLLAAFSVGTGSGAGSVGQANLANGAVGQAQVKTSTGSATAACSTTTLATVMNDYSFAPSLTDNCGTTRGGLFNYNVADPGDTVGRVTVQGAAGTGNLTHRWRYITASDNPTIWLIVDQSGDIKAVWTSDDPCEPTDTVPCIAVSPPCVGCTTKKLKSADLPFIFPLEEEQEANARITKRHGNAIHRQYRTLQGYSGDDAPSKWLFDNARFAGPNLQLKSGGVTLPKKDRGTPP